MPAVVLYCVPAVLIAAGVALPVVRPWLMARRTGAPLSVARLLGMQMAKVDVGRVVRCHVRLTRAGAAVPVEQIASHLLAGGNVDDVADGLGEAGAAGVSLSWQTATAIDLAGQDLIEAVRRAARDGTPVALAVRRR